MLNRLINWLSHPKVAHWFVLFLPVILLLPLMMIPQTLDDLVHYHVLAQSLPLFSSINWWSDLFIFLDGNAERTQQVVQQFLLPWWTDTDIKIAFFRPLSALTHWVDYQLWPHSHALNHLHSFIWFGVLIGLVFKLYQKLHTSYLLAILAGLLFAFDASHFITVTWVANRNLLVAAVFGVACLITFIEYRQSNQLIWYVFSLVLFGLCLLSAEAGVAIGAFIVSYLVCLDSAHLRNRFFMLVGYGVIFAIWYYFYQSMGYGASGNDFYTDPAQDPGEFIRALGWKYPLYVLLYFVGLPSAGYYGGGLPSAGLLLISIFVTLAIGLLLWPILKKSALSRFWVLAFILSLLPIAGSSPHERTMLIAGIAANALMAILFVVLFSKSKLLVKDYQFVFGRLGKSMLMPIVALFILLHAIIHPLGLAVIPMSTWAMHDESPLVKQASALPKIAQNQNARVFLNSPSTLFVSTLSLYQKMSGSGNEKSNIGSEYLLAPHIEAIEVQRKNDNTIRLLSRVEISSSVYDGLFRSKNRPISQGEVYKIGELTINVISVNDAGLPVIIDFSWPYSVDTLQVLAWNGEYFEQVSLPKTPNHSSLIIMP